MGANKVERKGAVVLPTSSGAFYCFIFCGLWCTIEIIIKLILIVFYAFPHKGQDGTSLREGNIQY